LLLLLQGPYEDIQGLLASADASATSLASLDRPGPPRIVDVRHVHEHLVPQSMPRRVAERLAEERTPPPPKVRIVQVPNRARKARHAKEDAQFAKHAAAPSVTTVDIRNRVTVEAPRVPARPLTYTVREQPNPAPAAGMGYSFPLVDRRLQRAKYSVIAETDGGSEGARVKPHTPAELQAEAAKLLSKAKAMQDARKAREDAKKKQKAEDQAMGIFNDKDEGFEDELTRLQRVSARMNRLLEQIERPHLSDSFEASIARKKYFLKLYRQMKAEATDIIESYALRTGNSIFSLFGNGKIDPSIAAFLPPNSVAGILAQYANPTRGREDETPRDVIAGKDAKRIQYSIDHWNAVKNKQMPPMPPAYAPSDEEIAAREQHKNPLLNKVIATQQGEFGQNRPAVTTGTQAIGRSSVHISVVNPAASQAVRGVPYEVNLKLKRKKLN
jgi:hypothetical protein